ncbi:NosR/NirI family nitrous oxide reductase transcriptional regulator [Inhella inkyongensis]|uniref:NosR/NirI family nitrous oxide reductase transcriptional regulator n=1 Tax=Inhella inkyongensis TaxID=392593 RepID=A0A840S3H5_9BURK|nr:NosR/NirI family protein [Inhella inkyongensis]MBB5203384.1 NosR/NirI family nitrous oxide reductase transcriptional regulator [Inhella inkyongensis]
MPVLHFLAALVAAFFLLTGSARGQAYEARLPDDLHSFPALCERVACNDVFPGAVRFSRRLGQPPYVEAYDAQNQLLGYVMLSTDITDTPAYSGKPVVTLIGMDKAGRFVGFKVLKHSEPILLLGIPESALTKFHDQYKGHSVAEQLEVGGGGGEATHLDAISGATVTVIAQNQVITTSGQAVAAQVGILPPTVREPAHFKLAGRLPSWSELVSEGAVQRLVVTPQQVGLPPGPEPFIELWFGSLDHPEIGQALLGRTNWESLRSRLQPQDKALFIIRTAGQESFKGSGFVRGGIYDRIQIKQGRDLFTFRDTDYLNLYSLQASGSPEYSEAAIFILRSKAFSAAHPWRLNFLGNRVDRATGQRSFANFEQRYWLDDERLEGGRPAVDDGSSAWKKVWAARPFALAGFIALLLATALVYSQRERLTRRSTHKNKWPVNGFKYTAWALSIGFVGFGLLAQPSITQVLTWFHSLLFQWQWELFLSDPFIFCFWVFIILTTFVWGRGLFCGWLCPFGSLQEGLFKLAGLLGLKRWQRLPPVALHHKLKQLKYAIFFGLFAVSLFSMTAAEMLAEVEPFKTTFLVGVLNRSWPYGLFVAAILGVAIFIERPYCKYLCPLGASLALPSTFRWFGLRRKAECNSCRACAKGCGSLAIDAAGRIDHRECLHCLDCMVLYTDTHACPPLAKERKARERTGQPLTAIDRQGYFIPIIPVESPRTIAPAQDPRTATEPVAPPHLARERSLAWLWAELCHHLLPWRASTWRTAGALQIAGIGLALAATLAWVLAWQSRLSAAAVVGWWIGWSLYEVLLRKKGMSFIKDGPWWKAQYRQAGWLDMVAYVGFKNLLIGAVLYLGLQGLGRLV